VKCLLGFLLCFPAGHHVHHHHAHHHHYVVVHHYRPSKVDASLAGHTGIKENGPPSVDPFPGVGALRK
jgi:hypothetical protein